MLIVTLLGLTDLIAAGMSAGFAVLQNIIIIDDLHFSIFDALMVVGWLNLVWNIVNWTISPRGVKIANPDKEFREKERKQARYLDYQVRTSRFRLK